MEACLVNTIIIIMNIIEKWDKWFGWPFWSETEPDSDASERDS